jgi:hypothetical protein
MTPTTVSWRLRATRPMGRRCCSSLTSHPWCAAIPDSGAGGRVLAEIVNTDAPVRRLGRRQPRRRRRGTRTVAAVLLVVDARTSARRTVPPARRAGLSPTTGNRRASAWKVGAWVRDGGVEFRVWHQGTIAPRWRSPRPNRRARAPSAALPGTTRVSSQGSAPTSGIATRSATRCSLILRRAAARRRARRVGGHRPGVRGSDPEWVGRVVTDFVTLRDPRRHLHRRRHVRRCHRATRRLRASVSPPSS